MKPSAKQRLKYHCVEVIAGADACDAAMSLKGVRLLSADAPLLPLKTCDAGECKCIYKHFDDRRQGPRRQFARMRIDPDLEESERRKRRGRRVTDYD